MLDLFLCCAVRLSRVRSFTREEEGRRKGDVTVFQLPNFNYGTNFGLLLLFGAKPKN